MVSITLQRGFLNKLYPHTIAVGVFYSINYAAVFNSEEAVYA
jgi:hypothetical protein